MKDFFRFYAATSDPRLSDKTTADSMVIVAEWFFAAFTRVTGTVIPEDDRSEVYKWIRQVLIAEGVVVNKRKPGHNFTEQDLILLLSILGSQDDLIFIPERYRVQFTYINRFYCWTGALIGTLFTNFLRYRDIEMVLQRTPNAPWKLIYKIYQQRLENDPGPEKIIFGTSLQEHDKFVYDDRSFLRSMAFADKALFGSNNLVDLQAEDILEGENELVLRWRDSALDQPILRKCTKARGTSDEPMPEKAFREFF